MIQVYLANLIGFFAVILFLLSYQQKKRINILICNATSRVLYVLQYILLSAFEGAVLDVLGILISIAAHRKDTPFVKKHIKLFIITGNILMLGAGILLYKNIFSLFSMLGVMLHINALCFNNEKKIRRMSIAGSPFWLIYNFTNKAYGSAVGDVLSIVSIALAMFRYDFKKKWQKTQIIDNKNQKKA